MDELDSRLIRALRQDSRQSVQALARRLDIRPSTAHARLQRLKAEGVIEGFTLKLNSRAVGEGFIVFLLLSTTKKLSPAFLADPHIKEAFGITGEYDLILKLKFPGVDEFNAFLLELRNKPNITKTLTMVATANLKEEL